MAIGLTSAGLGNKPLRAQSPGPQFDGVGISLPVRGVAPAGFTLTAYHGDLTRFGSLPLRMVIRPTGPTFPDDRQLSVRIGFPPWSVLPTSRAANYEFTVNLSASQTVFDQVYYLPKWFLGGSPQLSVWEAGQPLAGYGSEFESGSGVAYSRFDVSSAETDWVASAEGRFGWIAEPGSVAARSARSATDIEDLRMLMGSLAPDLFGFSLLASEESRLGLFREFGELVGLSYFTIEELASDWRGFEQCHVWVCRWSTLKAIEESRPEAAAALRRHLVCGGTLWLLETPEPDAVAAHFGTRIRPEEPAETEPRSGEELAVDIDAGVVSAMESLESEANILPLHPDTGEIRFPMPSFRPMGVRSSSGGSYSDGPLRPHRLLADRLMRTYIGEVFDDTSVVRRWVERAEGELFESDFSVLPVGFGRVVTCRREEALPGSFSQWQAMRMLTGVGSSGVLRDGVDPIVGDTRFWNWTIPGVAQPPIYSFLLLLTLFAVLVGPVAYGKLNRIGRAYLMFLVAPLLAALTTVALFTYGLLADGLGTQVRVREVTWLGGDAQDAARYCRATYFAGLRPADGLRFPTNARVVPYPLTNYRNWRNLFGNDNAALGTVRIDEDETVLRGGFFPSRQQCQFVSHRPLESADGVKWESDEIDSGVTARMRNGLGHSLRDITVRDEAGDYWSVEDLAAGATASAQRIEPEVAQTRLGELYTRQMPIAPISIGRDTQGNANLDLILMLGATFPYRQSLSPARAGTAEGEVEWWLRTHLQTRSRLPIAMFIAIADVSSDSIAVPKARQVDSIHYVIGELR
ncbi:MAG: hypothetical protein EA381_16070 [Planctomycetaceae bacterium]|nr:MAG: hypothetical protein EA381_16070 [Planctomycetaceae bacterium]